MFCSLTYRASRDWGQLLGFSAEGLAEMNHKAIAFYREIAGEVGLDPASTLYSGCIGPRGDAYQTNPTITAASAEDYHSGQIETFRKAGVDLVTALTLNSTEEAIGIAWAARAADVPSTISFTLDKNRMVDGTHTLRAAIEDVDAATDGAPAYYMINCSHPVDFEPALDGVAGSEEFAGFVPTPRRLSMACCPAEQAGGGRCHGTGEAAWRPRAALPAHQCIRWLLRD